MESLTLPVQAVVDPVGAIPRAIERRRWVGAVLWLGLATALSGVAVAVRLDTSRLVIPKMAMSGELAKATEREVEEAIEQAQRVAIVASVAKGLVLMPLAVLLIAVALKLSAWLLGRQAAFVACFTAAALAMVPIAVLHVIEVGSALRQPALSPKMVETLVPTSVAAFRPQAPPKLQRVFTALDVVNLWSALLLGLGFAVVTKWSRWRGLAWGVVLYVLFACTFLIGLPGLMAGGPGGGGMGGP